MHSEVRIQNPEVRIQKSEVRIQKSEFRRFWILTPVFCILVVSCAHGPLKKVFPKVEKNVYGEMLTSNVQSFDGHLGKSIESLQRAIAKEPNAAYLHYLLAQRYAEGQKIDLALATLTTVLNLKPHWTKGELFMARLYQTEGNFEASLKILEDTIRHSRGEEEEVYLHLAQSYVETKRYPQALHILRQLLRKNPELISAYYYIATIQSTYLKQHEEAIKTFRQILEWEPGNLRVRKAIAQIHLEKKNNNAALAEFLELEKLEPLDVGIQLQISLLYYEMGNVGEAAKRFENILKTNPEADRVRYYLGLLHEKNNEWTKAEESYSKIPVASGLYKEAKLRQARVLEKQNQRDRAIAVLQEAIRLQPETVEFYEFLAILWEDHGEITQAVKVLEQGVRKLPDAESLHFTLGIVFDRQENLSAGITQMKEVLRINPENASAMNYIGYVYAEQGQNLEEALGLVEKALKLKPKDGNITDSLGWVHFQMGNLPLAEKYIREALRLNPEEPTINEHMGDIYHKRNAKQKALYYYRRAVNLGKKRPSPDLKEIERVEAKIRALES